MSCENRPMAVCSWFLIRGMDRRERERASALPDQRRPAAKSCAARISAFRGVAAVMIAEQRGKQAGKHLLQVRAQRDETARAFLAVLDDPGQPQHLQMMAERGIGDVAIEGA